MAGNSGINVGFGTSGYALTSNGAGVLPTFQSLSTSGDALVFLGKQSSASTTAIQFNTQITSTYDNYSLVISNVTIQTGSALRAFLVVQLSSNGGSSYISTNYVNQYTTPAACTSGFALVVNVVTTPVVVGGQFYLLNLTAANNFPSSVGIGTYTYLTTSMNPVNTTSFYYNGPVASNAIQITMSDGSNFSGTFALYGMKQ